MAKAPAKQPSYEASDITVFEPLEAVRAKPGMYLGGKDSVAVTHTAFEILDNSVDEAMNGHGDLIQLHIGKDGYISVKDEGRGIPVGPHPKVKGVDSLTLVASRLHAGGKMNNSVYKSSGGVHGVGMAVVNAVSDSFEVWSYRNKQWNYQAFARGNEKTKVIKKDPPKLAGVTLKNQGTLIRFKPDFTVFDKGSTFLPKRVHERIENLTQLLPVKVTVIDEIKGKTKTYHKPEGMKGVFKKLMKDNELEPVTDEPFVYSDENVDVMVGWARTNQVNILSYVSYIRTTDGGTHVEGLKDAIFQGINDFCSTKDVYTKDAVMKGLVAVINIKMSGATFTSQDKVKLATKEVRQAVSSLLYWDEATDANGPLYEWMNKNKAIVRTLIDSANQYAALHAEFEASADLTKKLNTESKGRVILPQKLLVSDTKKPEERELFLIEGDSAKGSVAKGRDSHIHEVYPLRGKIPNIWKINPEKVFANDIVVDMLRSIGFKPKGRKKDGSEDEAHKPLRVGKVMILTDADDDGRHIAALLIGFFWKVMPHLIIERRLFVVKAPLYVYKDDSDIYFADTMVQLMGYKIKGMQNNKIQRLKGWGETTAEVMNRAAFDTRTRNLIQVEPLNQEDETKLQEELGRLIDMLGVDTEARRALI